MKWQLVRLFGQLYADIIVVNSRSRFSARVRAFKKQLHGSKKEEEKFLLQKIMKTPTKKQSSKEEQDGDEVDNDEVKEANGTNEKMDSSDEDSLERKLEEEKDEFDASVEEAHRKRARLKFFQTQLDFVTCLTNISTLLKQKGPTGRKERSNIINDSY